MPLDETTKFMFQICDTKHSTIVENFSIREQISEPFVITTNLVGEFEIDSHEVLEKEAVLTITSNSESRYFHGIVSNFMFTGQHDRFYMYEVTVVPTVWLLDLNKNYKIFQRMSVIDIVTQLLENNGIPSDTYSFKLESTYQTRRYCTQYGESDFEFMSRILEEEGIFYFFEHAEDSHCIVFSDTEAVYCPIGPESEIELNSDSGMVAEKETINDFAFNRAICPGKITHSNYNFKRPSLNMEVAREGDTHHGFEVYEYPGDYGLPTGGESKVNIHLETVKSLQESVEGTSNVARFIPGSTFTVNGDSFEGVNGEYCLLSVEHEGTQSCVYGEYSGIGGDYTYSNRFIAIPAATVYRTRKTFEKPCVRGLQSATVTGPKGEEIYTDEYGRIKVQFHWDREGKNDEKSSCWLRTSQPWSGNGWGFVSLPRIGDEVLVDFINGDPDWPIMVGTVNNAASPPLYKLPDNRTQSGIKTRSTPGGGPDNFSELRFEDKKGAEEIYLQSEKDFNVLIKNDQVQTVGGNSNITVKKSLSKNAADITLTADSKITLVCGGSTIVLDPSGITITGAIVNINP
jgi:type VI secretion system secreted protein VgrG